MSSFFRYSMEAHAVHYNKKYGNFASACGEHDGIAVVAFFLQATDNDEHPCFNKLATAVEKIVKINTTTDVPSGNKLNTIKSINIYTYFLILNYLF